MTAFVEGKCSLDAVDFYHWGFMEKKVKVGKQFVTFSLWEAGILNVKGGEKEHDRRRTNSRRGGEKAERDEHKQEHQENKSNRYRKKSRKKQEVKERASSHLTTYLLPQQNKSRKAQLTDDISSCAVILFFFDLTRLDTLANIKAWYQECRRHNKTAYRVLVGGKFDLFYETSKEEEAGGGGGDHERKAEEALTESKAKVLTQARRYAKAMKCPLVFTSVNPKINVTTTMKVALRLACGLSLADIETKTNDHSPLVEFNPPIARAPRSLKEQCVRYVRRTWSEAGGGEAEGRERWDLAMLPLDLQELFVAKKT
ncbi:Ras GTPase tem1 [Balamuthia mandrillaris]